MKKNRNNYLILIIYGLGLIFLLLGLNHVYGSSTDWFNQHTIFPDYFRNFFYETKQILPDMAFNIGAGQNIYNFSYYGFLSPIILFSYLLPFLNMTTYLILINIILYLLSGFLMYKWLNNNFKNNKLSLFSGLIILTLSPLTYQFHHHFMFVSYLPFLLLALIGIDKYLKDSKSLLLIISIFLIILTNYYFSISCLFALGIYFIYKAISLKKFNFKTLGKGVLRVVIAIFLAGVLLLPTIRTILSTSRVVNEVITLKDYLVIDFSRFMYAPFGLGISGMFIVALFSNIFTSKKSEVKFLNIVLLLIISLPFVMYILNGLLYIRGKVLIPFIPLYILCLVEFMKNIKSFKWTNLYLIFFLYLLIYTLLDLTNILYVLEIIISFLLVLLFKNKKKLIYIYIFIILFLSSFITNMTEDYVKIDEYKKINTQDINYLLREREKDTYYRTDILYYPNNNLNKVYQKDYYSTTLYSSTYNENYWQFYNSIGNNIRFRNYLMSAGSKNDLFNTFMGVKYIIAKDYDSLYYQKVASMSGKVNLNLYYNKHAYPLIYVSNNIGSLKEYNKLSFPYNLEYLMNKTVVDSNVKEQNTTNIKKYDSVNIKDTYKFSNNKKEEKIYKLPSDYQNKILYISFDMNKSNSCSKQDTSITINGITNTLTCKTWRYHNQNYHFQYVIPLINNELKVKVSKGNFDITNVNVAYSVTMFNSLEELNELKINQQKSTITGNVSLQEYSYLVTSIPYDEGFTIYVNGKMQKKEKVNVAFLGCKLKKGKNNIVIKYTAPLKKEGLVLTIIGLFSLISLYLWEKRKR